MSAGSTPTAARLGPRRRDRGAPGDVRVRRPPAGRSRVDRARMPWPRRSPPVSSASMAAAAPVRRRRRGQDPGQGPRGYVAGHGVIPELGGAIVARVADYHGVVDVGPDGPLPDGRARSCRSCPNHICPVVNLVDAFTVTTRGRDRRDAGRSTRAVATAEGSQPRVASPGRAPRRRVEDLRRPERSGPRRRAGSAAAPPCSRRRSRPAHRVPDRRRGPGRSTSPSCARIPAASHASGSPETFAEVVGNGPTPRASARGASWSGTRRPIVGAAAGQDRRPAARRGAAGPRPSGRRASTPPQAPPRPACIEPARAAWAASSRSSMTALSGGRRFTWNSRSMPPGVAAATAMP